MEEGRRRRKGERGGEEEEKGREGGRRRRKRKEDRHNRRDRKDGVPYLLVQLSPHSVLGLHLSWALLGSDNGPS